MEHLATLIKKVAVLNNAVLIEGETGTGKELVARALHAFSLRRRRAFEILNCSQLVPELAVSQLFGDKKGAYTGASGSKGMLAEASEGTFFFDEIETLRPDIQATLLRFLDDGEIRPVGGHRQTIDVRVIAATNVDATKLVDNGYLREDLYHRFDLKIRVPPLRERKEDISALARYYIREFSRGRAILTDEALAILKQWNWPGNIRQLRNVLRDITLSHEGEARITPRHLPELILGPSVRAIK